MIVYTQEPPRLSTLVGQKVFKIFKIKTLNFTGLADSKQFFSERYSNYARLQSDFIWFVQLRSTDVEMVTDADESQFRPFFAPVN